MSTETVMTRAQFATLAAQHRAQFHSKKDAIDWWRLPDGSWFGARDTGQPGMVQVRRFPAGACAC
jgi:hypothetical protein